MIMQNEHHFRVCSSCMSTWCAHQARTARSNERTPCLQKTLNDPGSLLFFPPFFKKFICEDIMSHLHPLTGEAVGGGEK